MPSISLDSTYAPEVLEFWGHKYRETKAELEKLKASSALQVQRNELSQDHANLKNLITALQNESKSREAANAELRKMMLSAREDETAMKAKLDIIEQERRDLAVHFAKSEAEVTSLRQQIHVFYSQAAALGAEADRSRRDAITAMFPSESFVDPNFDCTLQFTSPPTVIRALPPKVSGENRIFFLPRPPSCMPLRVPSCGQSGYWFYPSCVLPSDTAFELVVEGRVGEWSYLGCYLSVILEDYPMKLAEWLILDEQTKLSHCVRVASHGLPADQTASYPAQLDVRRRYEVGEWSVPCYSLRCVGFNMALYEALCAAVEINSREDAVSTAGSEYQSVSGKRRLDDSAVSTHTNKKGRSASQTVQQTEGKV